MSSKIERPTALILIELTHQQLRQWQNTHQDLVAAKASTKEIAYCQQKIDQLLIELTQLSDWKS